MKKLITVDADTLTSTPLPALQYVVDQLLPQGLHILAGAPKIGKSWLALWPCLRVAKGEKVWDFETKQGSVLYLCLEDSYARVQRRLLQLSEDSPAALRFANLSERIGGGLEAQLKDFLSEHPGTVLVVIDTLQKVRGSAMDSNPYANDYRDISALKALADQHGIAILLIHHLRKMNDEDPLNMISGTTGISGATDSSFVLKPSRRGSDSAVLYCTGRDIEYRELPLRFQRDTHTWELTETVAAEAKVIDPTLSSLSAFLKELIVFNGSATELSLLLEQKTGEQVLPSVLAKRLVRYASELDKAGVHVSSSRTRDTRLLHILCDGDGSDGNDGKTDMEPVPNLLSQPSHPSPAGSSPLSEAIQGSDYDAMTVALCGGKESSQSSESIENTGVSA